MNNTQESSQKMVEIINKSTNGAIVLPPNPSIDAIASATALYLALIKMGKNINLVSSTQVNSDLHAADKINTQLVNNGDNLVISFPYEDGSIDKVDYNIKDNTFNLVITPRQGFPKLDPEKVQFAYTGGLIDFIITIDAPNLNALGPIYRDYQKEIANSPIINIDRHLVNDLFGRVNIVDKTSSSTSQLCLALLQDLQADIDKDMATNLYAGLTAATNNFSSYSVNAETFESAAALLKLGAVKKTVRPPQQSGNPTPQSGARNPQEQPRQFMKNVPNPFGQRSQETQPRPSQSANPVKPEAIPDSTPPQRPVQNQPQQMAPQPIEEQPQTPPSENEAAPQDWLKPKIFRGSGGLV
jgi:hypothetical protein